MLEVFGPSGEAQTLGLAVPNRAFYQLNYTRIFSFCYYTTLGAKMKVFPVCGQSCGQGRISVRFHDPLKSRKHLWRKAFRASASQVEDGASTTPKAGALPTALIPVIYLIRYSLQNYSKFCRFLRPPSCLPIPVRCSRSPIGTLPRNRLAPSATGGASAISPKQARNNPCYALPSPIIRDGSDFFKHFLPCGRL